MPKKTIPSKLRWLFWSYDISSLNLNKDKDYIIPQVLNYGTWDDVRWLQKVYLEQKIREVVKNPSRGIWFEKVLNFWTTIFNIRLKKDIREKAIFNINPSKH